MNLSHKIFAWLFICLFLGSNGSADETTLTNNEKGEQIFSLHVGQIFSDKCNACHGADQDEIQGELNLTSLAGLMAGGATRDDLLLPGNPEKSFLLDVVSWKDPDYEMPPKANDRLTESQIQKIREWIEYGAPWPDAATRQKYVEAERQKVRTEAGVLVATSGGLSDDWTYRRYKDEDIWAFQPLATPTVPSGPEGQGKPKNANPIDAFIAAKLAGAGFDPAPRADPNVLIRRASYDLVGLPPTHREVNEFLLAWKKSPSGAWTDLIDRLLESRQYGERWAQHWLDVARYADTAGLSNDYERSNAWRYRDYVIRAFNDDKPYDEFIIEQIAGDELADEQMRERCTDEKAFADSRRSGDYTEAEVELLVASGFLRMGPWDPAMVKTPEARQLYVDDVVNAVGQTFLSTTMRCFKCHDHKFDPLPTRDYYRMYAAFAGTQMAERSAPFMSSESTDRFEDGEELVQRLKSFADEKVEWLENKTSEAADQWLAERGIPKPAGTKAELADIPDDQKPPRHIGLSEEEKGRLKVRQQDQWIWERRLERYRPMVQSVYNGPTPKKLNGRKLRIPEHVDADWNPECHILSGGSLEAPGQAVTPGVLSATRVAIKEAPADDPYGIGDDLHGRRLALAEWIADDRNPLTARSIVNRVWQYHFGKPLAGNPNNFGGSGKKPTHPELLDWLAGNFVENGWKLKRLHRLIMSSATYQQSGKHSDIDRIERVDADNDLLAMFPNRRLTAEEIRDSMLQITGELNLTAGGVPVMPEMNMEVALQPRMIQFSLSPAYQPSRTPEERNRRSIYSYRVRGLADPFLETFNQPNANDSCEERDVASVSPQAFTLLNSDVVTDRSIALALRVENEADAVVARIRRAVELVFARTPTDAEEKKLLKYVQDMEDYHAKTPVKKKDYPTSISRSVVEEFSGQPFSYEEILPVYENYVPDKKSADVSAETRALADLCLALFNSNEFIYVY